MSPGESEPRASLWIPKTSAGAAIRLLVRAQLLDNRSRFIEVGQTLVVPLAREPTSQEIGALEESVGTVVLGKDHFEPKSRNVFSLQEVLEHELPPELMASLPASLDIIGDIALIELAQELAPYEEILARGILKVNRNVRVVLAKAGTVSGFERIRPIRYLAGEHRTQTVHRESGCRFKIDMSKAYFSPRLSHEHQRVTVQVEPGEVVIDMFAGVGPFAVMIAKKLDDVEVNAVDANPDAVSLIRDNVKLNKIRGKLNIWPGDATEVVETHLTGIASRVIMNHPSAAKTFVGVACRGLRRQGGLIHYYTFAEGVHCEQGALTEFQDALQGCGWKVKELGEVRRVRGVSPMRWQVVVDAKVAPAMAIS